MLLTHSLKATLVWYQPLSLYEAIFWFQAFAFNFNLCRYGPAEATLRAATNETPVTVRGSGKRILDFCSNKFCSNELLQQ